MKEEQAETGKAKEEKAVTDRLRQFGVHAQSPQTTTQDSFTWRTP